MLRSSVPELLEGTWLKIESRQRYIQQLQASARARASTKAQRSWTKKISNTTAAMVQQLTSDSLPLEEQPLRVILHIPICVGFPEAIKPEELLALIRSAKAKGYEFVIYLDVQTEGAFNDWRLLNCQVIKELGESGRVMKLSEYRQTPAWQAAHAALNALKEGSARGKQLFKFDGASQGHDASLLEKAVYKIKGTHPDWNDKKVIDHMMDCVTDMASWHNREGVPSKVLNVLVYQHFGSELYPAVLRAMRRERGYDGSTYVHVRPEYLQPSLSQESSNNTSTTTSEALVLAEVMIKAMHEGLVKRAAALLNRPEAEQARDEIREILAMILHIPTPTAVLKEMGSVFAPHSQRSSDASSRVPPLRHSSVAHCSAFAHPYSPPRSMADQTRVVVHPLSFSLGQTRDG